MSTKAIRKVLGLLKDALGDHPNAPTDELRVCHGEARAELDAIEKAARTISDDASVFAIQRDDEDAVDEAVGLLESIAEQSEK